MKITHDVDLILVELRINYFTADLTMKNILFRRGGTAFQSAYITTFDTFGELSSKGRVT